VGGVSLKINRRLERATEQAVAAATKKELRLFLELLRSQVGEEEFIRLVHEYRCWQRRPRTSDGPA
jgi:hypothetical protein